jgi:hypothetical protein
MAASFKMDDDDVEEEEEGDDADDDEDADDAGLSLASRNRFMKCDTSTF